MSAIAKGNRRLQQLELDIEQGIRSAGKALLEIHETKAYVDDYETFENYCKTRWNWTDRHARNLIDAERVRSKIGTLVPVSELKDKHLLAISKVPEKQQAQVAAKVLENCEAENRAPTEKDFKAAAKPFVQPKEDVEYEDVPDERQPGEGSEPLPDEFPAKIAKLKSAIKQHNAAMMRLVDELQTLAPNTRKHEGVLSSFRFIDSAIGSWK